MKIVLCFTAVILEIEDREKFLADMEMLGQGSKYRASIIHTIQDRISKLEALLSKLAVKYKLKEVTDMANKYRKKPGTPKTEWF